MTKYPWIRAEFARNAMEPERKYGNIENLKIIVVGGFHHAQCAMEQGNYHNVISSRGLSQGRKPLDKPAVK